MGRAKAGWVVIAVAMAGTGAIGQEGATGKKGAPGPIVAGGASFAEPRGWTRLRPTQAKTLGWFIDPGSSSRDPRRMILVDFGKPTEPDARRSAEGLAKQWGGSVHEGPVALDGAPGFLVTAENRGPGLKPVVAIVVHRAGRAYMLMGGAVPGQSVADEFEQVRAGWKWVAGR